MIMIMIALIVINIIITIIIITTTTIIIIIMVWATRAGEAFPSVAAGSAAWKPEESCSGKPFWEPDLLGCLWGPVGMYLRAYWGPSRQAFWDRVCGREAAARGIMFPESFLGT